MTVRDTPWPAGTPCWVDLIARDPAAARRFYAELFGWLVEAGGPEAGGYAMATVEGRNVAGFNGEMQLDHPPVWSTYLACNDLDAAIAAAEQAGATLAIPAMDVMDAGRMAFLQAPGGGVFGLWQAGRHTGFGVANEPNTVTWNEFVTRDYAGAKEFYSAVFGYTYTELGDGTFQYSTIEVDGNTVGGIGTLPAEVPAHVPPHWRVYFAVPDCDAAVARVSELGGSVLRPPADMPYGRHADVADPQGAMFALIKPAAPGG
jgi:uncharacterized protein